jgi:hypothetical protein
METTEKKICTQCKKKLSFDNFYIDRTIITKISYRAKCKACCKINQDNRIKQNIDITLSEKKCNVCNEVKSISMFYKNTRCKDGYFKFCDKCHTEKVNNKGNNIKIKRTVEYMKEYNKKRNLDIIYKLKHSLRSSIRNNLIRKSSTDLKTERTLKYVNCDIPFFKLWIEYNFDDKMSWDNHGDYWHLDHIKPCASFDLTKSEEISKCYNWTNYRPCEKIANILKSNKIDNELIEKYVHIKNNFLKITKHIVESNMYKVLLPVDESSTIIC